MLVQLSVRAGDLRLLYGRPANDFTSTRSMLVKLSVRAGDPRLLYGRPVQAAQPSTAAQQPQPQPQQQQHYSAYNSAAPTAASAPGYAQPVDPRRAVPSDPRLGSAPGMPRLVNPMFQISCIRTRALKPNFPASRTILHRCVGMRNLLCSSGR